MKSEDSVVKMAPGCRTATEIDYPTLQDMWEQAVEATHGFLARGDFDFYKYRLPRYFWDAELSVYEDSDGIKGFAGVSDKKLEMLFVSERGTGVGSRLPEHVIVHQGVREVDVNEQNTAALAFYTARGFTVRGRRQRDGEGLPRPILNMEMNYLAAELRGIVGK